jgi:hypothetical protein
LHSIHAEAPREEEGNDEDDATGPYARPPDEKADDCGNGMSEEHCEYSVNCKHALRVKRDDAWDDQN